MEVVERVREEAQEGTGLGSEEPGVGCGPCCAAARASGSLSPRSIVQGSLASWRLEAGGLVGHSEHPCQRQNMMKEPVAGATAADMLGSVISQMRELMGQEVAQLGTSSMGSRPGVARGREGTDSVVGSHGPEGQHPGQVGVSGR